MKCVLLLLTFVALSYSYPYGVEYGSQRGSGRNINISEDGTIDITANGKRITITKGTGRSGQKTVDISVSGPNIPTKRIQINEQNQLSVGGQGEYDQDSEDYLRDKRSSKDSRKQKSQGETLTQILSGYQGDIDQVTFQRLLNEINAAVRAGQLNSSVYDVLQSLEKEEADRQRGIIGGGQAQEDVLELLRERAIEQEIEQLQKEQLLRGGLTGLQYPRSQVGGARRSGLASGIRGGWDVSGQQRIGGIGSITGTGPRNLLEADVRDLLRQSGQVGTIGQTIPEQLSEAIQEAREILEEERDIQQQQLLQQQQQQQLLQLQLLQQQKQEQQQLQQQLLQQAQQEQLQRQEQLLQQQYQQQPNWRALLNSGRSVSQRRQQGLWEQQPGVLAQEGLLGGYGQGIPAIQRYNVPFVL